MRFSIVAAVAALSSTALAQGGDLLAQIPKCAQACFGNNLGSCGFADIACICGNSNVINSVSCCVFATCSQAEITAVTNFAVNLCKVANVNVNTNPTCPSGTAAPSGSAAASASGSRPASASGASATPASGSASASGASGASASRTAASGSASGAPAASGASGASAAASSRPATGAAPLPTAAAGYGLGMVVAGVIAAL